MYPDSLKNLIDCLKCLPGIGDKTAERLAFSMINFDKQICSICSNIDRNGDIVFVVEKPKDVSLFEKINVYKGVYHVLDGLILPLDGVNPEDINLKKLIERINEGKIKEVILALKPSIEGETTMQYIRRILEKKDVKITKIATGIPIGTDMEYIDAMTLEMSLEERKEFS